MTRYFLPNLVFLYIGLGFFTFALRMKATLSCLEIILFTPFDSFGAFSKVLYGSTAFKKHVFTYSQKIQLDVMSTYGFWRQMYLSESQTTCLGRIHVSDWLHFYKGFSKCEL